jgi:hypothetical protein
MVKDLSSPMFVFRNKDQKPLPTVESRARMLVVGKFYEKPNITKLTPEQAKLKLLGPASGADQGTKNFMEKMFTDSDATNGIICPFLERLYWLEDPR